MESDPFYGRIHFRRLRNIATGESMPNMYCGRRVPSWFVRWTSFRAISMRRHFTKHWRNLAARVSR
jgi:hypothetical protein